jgi:protein-S-isoprenylcysteine O-methyltransferase Ste14
MLMTAIRAALRGLLIFSGPLVLPLAFIPGDHWRWPTGWSFLAVYAVVAIGGSVALAKWRPESFKVRLQGFVARKEQKQPLVDAVGLIAYVAYIVAWIAFIPVDVFVLKLLPIPSATVSALGALVSIAGMVLGQLAVAENRFAAPTVQDQTAQGHEVIDTGLYGVVRHPLYAANLLVFGGMAVWLGSYAALVGVLVMLAFTLARIPIEERVLRTALPDYADYARRVPSRLIPFVF